MQQRNIPKWKKFILWFAQEHVDFRSEEIKSIVKLLGLEFRKISEDSLKPFWIVEFPNEEAACKLASRAVSLRCILELWGHAKSVELLHRNVQNYVKVNHISVQNYFKANSSFKITVETYNKHFTQVEKLEKIESFSYLPIEGKVDLKRPMTEWWYIEFWGLDPKTVPVSPEDILFGRLLCTGQRHLIKELSLKQRKFIGNTSMDAQLSILMANQALASSNDLIFDPFVGTGSLLVSAAKFGGYVLGADIDFMTLHARSRPSRISQKRREKDENVLANLKQYGCSHRYLDVVVSDFSNPIWRDGLKFDSIITDPPYGIREATEKIKTKICAKASVRRENTPHYPSTSHYSLQELYSDLLTFASKYLKLGGRLVCWFPFHREDYSERVLPTHDCLTIVANSEQFLTAMTSRRLLTYEKFKEPNNNDHVTMQMNISLPQVSNFRSRYFENDVETRSERRQRQAEMREKGRLEALKRGKFLTENLKIHKSNLNRKRFS